MISRNNRALFGFGSQSGEHGDSASSDSEGDAPQTLVIASTDPVLDSTLFKQLKARRIVAWRSRGPVVPCYGSQYDDLAAVLEHAVLDLGVREIAICGHLPNDSAWPSLRQNEMSTDDQGVKYLTAIHQIVKARYGNLEAEEMMRAVVEENVFSQTANLRTYPVVTNGVASGKLKLQNWIYDTRRDELYGHSPTQSPLLSHIQNCSAAASPKRPFLDPCDIYLA